MIRRLSAGAVIVLHSLRGLRWSLLSLVAAVAINLVGCSPIINVNGTVLDPDDKAALQTGQTRVEVLKLLGTPSNISLFDDQKWYYVSRRSVTWAFFPPWNTDQNIVIVHFDKTGKVNSIIDQSGFEKNISVSPNSEITPTRGHEFGLLQEFLGNLGRFSAAK